jgi:hypothetical protein
MRIRILALSAVIAFCVSAGAAHAQTISGTLTDAVSGVPLGNDHAHDSFGVSVYDTDGKLVATPLASAQGTYFVSVPAGTYFLRAFGSLS